MARLVRDRLLARVILHGVVLLGVSAVGFLAIALALVGSTVDRDMKAFTEWFGEQACERMAHAEDPQADIARFPAAVAVYTRDGRRVAASAEHPLALSADELAQSAAGPSSELARSRLTTVTCRHDPSRFAVVGGPPLGLPLGRLSVLVAAMVLLVALGSVPLARSLVRPLRELVASVETFGDGDLTVRARASRTDEIGDLARAFNSMAANLQAHLMAEKELLANVSHELRTPLARVRVVLETAKEDPSRAATLLGEISRDLTDLERLTDDVLATIRLDFAAAGPSAKIRVRPEWVDLNALLQRAVGRCVETHPEREIELDVRGEVAGVVGDPALLLRLHENLLENACKYSSSAIRVVIEQHDATLVVRVEDDGIGIDPSDLERVFEPFFRSDRSRGRASGGTGLGLTLCRRIVEVHDGTIVAESAAGVGTVVIVRLPAARSQA